ncbi:MAG: tetratricopeptide repeat protein [Candidatus Margulisiibacteriota bacterium]
MKVPGAERGGNRPKVYNNILIGIFFREQGITPHGNLHVLTGLKFKRELQPELQKCLSGVRDLFVSHSLSFHQLEALFNHPDQLAQHLCRENGTTKLLSPEGISASIKVLLETKPLEGIKLLEQKTKLFTPEKIAALLRCNLGSIAACFTEQNVNEAEFRIALGLLKSNGSFDLQQAFCRELAETAKHDESWAVLALDEFCRHFPAQPWFHETAGDLQLGLGLAKEALAAFQAALRLDPQNKKLPPKIKAADRAVKTDRKETENKHEELRKTVLALWAKCGSEEPAGRELVALSQTRLFEQIANLLENDLTLSRNDEVTVKKLAALEKLAAERGDAVLARFCRYLQNKHLSEMVNKIAKGNAVERRIANTNIIDLGIPNFIRELLGNDELELGHTRLNPAALDGLAGSKEQVWDKLIASGYINNKGDLLEFDGVRRHFSLGEEISPKAADAAYKALYQASYYPLVERLAAAADNKTHKNQELCALIMDNLFGKHYRAYLAEYKQRRWDEALAELLACYRLNPAAENLDRQTAGLLSVMAHKTGEAGDTAGAIALYRRALFYDAFSLIALERLSLLHLSLRQFPAAAAYARTIIALELPPGQNAGERRAELEGTRTAAFGNLALALLMAHVQSGAPEYLQEAAASIEEALRRDPKNVKSHMNRAKIRLLQGRTAEVAEWLNGFLAGPKAEPMLIVDFTKQAFDRYAASGDREERAQLRTLLAKLVDHLTGAVATCEQLCAEYPIMMVGFAGNCQDLGLVEESARLIAAIMRHNGRDSGAYNYCLTMQARNDSHLGRDKAAAEKLISVIGADVSLRVYEEHLGAFQSLRIYAAELLTAIFVGSDKEGPEKRLNCKKGEKVLARLIKDFPHSPILWSCLGCLQEEQGKTGQARASYERSMAVDPSYLVARLNYLEMLFTEKGETPEFAAELAGLTATVRDILRRGRENDKELDRLRINFTYKILVALYQKMKAPEIVELLKIILTEGEAFGLAAHFQNALAEIKETEEGVPAEIAALIPART